jgi:H+/Cl- antiporter ClcA
MGPLLEAAHVPPRSTLIDRRVVMLCGLAIVLGLLAGGIAQVLTALIGLITNLSYYQEFSFQFRTPAEHHLGWLAVFVPVVGGIIVGFMARYGSKAIRGHGIPETMEQVLTNQSRIPPRMTFLKPLSAAVAIGTGGPFGAEGPIIATGGALGSLIGQMLSTTTAERKTLLAAGAAAGMAATFGSPVAAVLLAMELLLFEFRPRSLVPVAFASTAAAGMHMLFHGTEPVFAMPDLSRPSGGALAMYILVGALLGVASVYITRLVYFIEDAFEHLPIHWMWWPAIGSAVVGLVGLMGVQGRLTLGVGYSNITHIISHDWTWQFLAILCILKLVSWAVSLGSGTSGGTLAPLFTIGGAIGAVLGIALAALFPSLGIDPRIAALVGMAAIFAGASRALLASVVFAFETTLQPLGLLPLLGGCTAAYLVSCLLMRQTIMTEKIARRGIRVPSEYHADLLDQIHVRDVGVKALITLGIAQTVGEVRKFITSGEPGSTHQGFPIVTPEGHLAGVLTRRDLLEPTHAAEKILQELLRRPPVVVYDDCSLREAVDHLVRHDVGRLPVISREHAGKLVGIITRSDILSANRRRLNEGLRQPASVALPRFGRPGVPQDGSPA